MKYDKSVHTNLILDEMVKFLVKIQKKKKKETTLIT